MHAVSHSAHSAYSVRQAGLTGGLLSNAALGLDTVLAEDMIVDYSDGMARPSHSHIPDLRP